MAIIKKINIKNFKSICNFDLHLYSINFLVGVNGSGKTTVIHALLFASQLVRGQIFKWFEEQNWLGADFSNKSQDPNILPHLSIEVELDNKENIIWSFDFNPISLTCLNEQLSINGTNIYLNPKRSSDQIGSFLPQQNFNDTHIQDCVAEFIQFMHGISTIQPDVKSLTSFVMGLDQAAKSALLSSLHRFYPNIVDFGIKLDGPDTGHLVFQESTSSQIIEIKANHIGKGVLHVLAILGQIHSKAPVIVFESIEESIGQECIETLSEVLLQAREHSQLIITTHGHLLLNYIPDTDAIHGLKYIFKTLNGETKSINFFELPHIIEKLNSMGVGDALLDTDLTDLSNYY